MRNPGFLACQSRSNAGNGWEVNTGDIARKWLLEILQLVALRSLAGDVEGRGFQAIVLEDLGEAPRVESLARLAPVSPRLLGLAFQAVE
jgi:hypothetical protein